MAINLLFNCSYSEIWVHPENWKTVTTQKSLKQNWYVECKFFDPIFKEKYPYGYPFRKKVNRFKTLNERKAAIQLLLKEIPVIFEKKGWNPITKRFMIPEPKPTQGTLYPKQNFIEALEVAYPKLSVSDGVKKELRRIIAKLKKSADEQRIEFPICEIHSGYVRDLLDYLILTPNEYNKYLTHLSIVLSDLVEKRIVFHNPIRDIKKKKTVKKIRETLEIDELTKIFKILKTNHPTFYRYGMIFFHSGARSAELFRVQKKHVNLEKQEYKVTICKGNVYREVKKVILNKALPFWKEILNECSSDDDYLFTRGLQPSLVPTKPYQITKRWKRLIKDKYGVTADFYSLKHLFLDEIDKLSNLAGHAGSHTTDVTERFYLFGSENRKNEALKKIQLNILDAV
ncbi:tyrosine-type recombinase/integrase [Flavobacterium sp. SUN046]|uniref:tyrosine-type recombinase/integrase n=1 Tax=Flavobacterium sp. SUN046 TaxID=3002440 RepID=UPI002DB80EC3|nr:tyrosine-type recombinase/integrase [Flavobacterium sp. SUN046]MEC4050673.1 tyrosine-type recombinase/integrase [Flavobacterium sp. SUN046]